MGCDMTFSYVILSLPRAKAYWLSLLQMTPLNEKYSLG